MHMLLTFNLGYGIINADGELWKAQRKAGLRFLNTPNLKALTDVALPKYLKCTIKSLQARGPEELVDLESEFHEMTTQLMGQMAYDVSLRKNALCSWDMLNSQMDMHATDPFSVAFEYASGKTGERFQNPLWRVTEMFLGRKFRKSVSQVKRFGVDIVANAVKARGSKKAADDTTGDEAVESLSGSLINSLLDLIPDHQMVADAALNYLSAGRDTTAQALTWTFYLLMRHPQVVTKIRHELSTLDSLDLARLTPSSLTYTMAVFYESLRLYPPVPFEIRQCDQPATLPDATYLPRGTVVVWCPWAMNRSRATWGPDSHKFRPERWLADSPRDGNDDDGGDGGATTVRLVSRPSWEFPVFNGGPRTCLGKKMAEAIAAMAVASLVYRFDFVDAENGKPRRSRNSLTLPMDGGLPCYVRQRMHA